METALSYVIMFVAAWIGTGLAIVFDRWVHKHNWRGWSLPDSYEEPGNDGTKDTE